jgi:hypothetical protein
LDILNAEVEQHADLGVVDVRRDVPNRRVGCIGLMDVEPPPVQIGRSPPRVPRLEPESELLVELDSLVEISDLADHAGCALELHQVILLTVMLGVRRSRRSAPRQTRVAEIDTSVYYSS